jgi:hypothetical protein
MLDLPNQLFQHPLVRGHLVIGCRQHDNPERELLEIVLKLETFVDSQEDVITAFDFPDKDVILLARPSQVSDRIDGRSRRLDRIRGARRGLMHSSTRMRRFRDQILRQLKVPLNEFP